MQWVDSVRDLWYTIVNLHGNDPCTEANDTNVFDFDNTLYRGESAVDFALFMMKHNSRIVRWLPSIFWNLLKYKLCLVTRENMQHTINVFMKDALPGRTEILRQAQGFWVSHAQHLDPRMLERVQPEDIIITAGPDFLLEIIRDRLGTDHILSSEADLTKKEVIYLNFGSNKVKRFRERCGGAVIDTFYTDSYNDRALMEIAKTVFLVKKGRLRQIK